MSQLTPIDILIILLIVAGFGFMTGCVSNDTLQQAMEAEGKSFCQGVCVTDLTRAPSEPPESDPVEVKLTIEVRDGLPVAVDLEPLEGTHEECSKEYPEGCDE